MSSDETSHENRNEGEICVIDFLRVNSFSIREIFMPEAGNLDHI